MVESLRLTSVRLSFSDGAIVTRLCCLVSQTTRGRAIAIRQLRPPMPFSAQSLTADISASTLALLTSASRLSRSAGERHNLAAAAVVRKRKGASQNAQHSPYRITANVSLHWPAAVGSRMAVSLPRGLPLRDGFREACLEIQCHAGEQRHTNMQCRRGRVV